MRSCKLLGISIGGKNSYHASVNNTHGFGPACLVRDGYETGALTVEVHTVISAVINNRLPGLCCSNCYSYLISAFEILFGFHSSYLDNFTLFLYIW